MFISKDDDGAGERGWDLLQLGIGNGNAAVAVFKSGNAETLLTDTSNSLTAGTISLIVGTYQFVADLSSILRLFVDGVQVATRSDAYGPPQTTPTNPEIGRRAFAGNLHSFDGNMLFAGYAPRLFSPAQILAWSRDPFGPFRMVDEVGVVFGFSAAASFPPWGIPIGHQRLPSRSRCQARDSGAAYRRTSVSSWICARTASAFPVRTSAAHNRSTVS